jgi:hypothetical protein
MPFETKTSFCACADYFCSTPCVTRPQTPADAIAIAAKIAAKHRSLNTQIEITLSKDVIHARKAANQATTALAGLIGHDIEYPPDAIQILTERIARANRAEASFTEDDTARIKELQLQIAPLAAELKRLERRESAAKSAVVVRTLSQKRLATIMENDGAEYNEHLNTWKRAIETLDEQSSTLAGLRAERASMESTFDRGLIHQFADAQMALKNAEFEQELRAKFFVNGVAIKREDVFREVRAPVPFSLDDSDESFQTKKRKAQNDLAAAAVELTKKQKE